MLILIDADPIVYRAGFASETPEYHIVAENKETLEMEQHVFSPSAAKGDEPAKTAGAQMKEWKKATKDTHNILEQDKVSIPHPKSHALQAAKSMVANCVDDIRRKFKLSHVDVRLLLSGPENFRDNIATVRGYKANRAGAPKPHWYQTIRNYLTDNMGAEVIHGREADDECAILQRSDGTTIIATVDKDLDMVPGEHYDFVKKVFYSVDEDEGMELFYRQVLTGDTTDNIVGAYKVGPAAASRALVDILDTVGMDEGLVWERVIEVYQGTLDKYGKKCEYFALAEEHGVEAVCLEMARLVWMQRYVGQLWTPPGQEDDNLEFQIDD